MKVAVLLAVNGFSAIASAAIATINPCPSCPSTARPPLITVTAQYQPVSTCTPLQVCTTDTADISATSATLTCRFEPECTTYDFVSTVVPILGGLSSTTVTDIDALVTLAHTSTVLTSLIPITTLAPIFNGTLAIQNTTATNYTLTRYETLVLDTWCPYREMGPLAIPGYAGSGLCKACTADPRVLSQVVTVRDCHDDSACSTTTKTWISRLPIKTSTSQVSVSTQTLLPIAGTYVIPVTTVCQPYDSHYNPVTKSFAVTTAVHNPTLVHITKIIDITFIGHPAPTATTTLSSCALSTSTYCPSNGIHTVPMVTTIYPTLPGYGGPIIIDIDYTITVINAPTFIFPSTIIIVTLTSTPETVTVISGTTLTATVTAPVTTTVTTTASDGGVIDPGVGSETETISFTETESEPAFPTDTITVTDTATATVTEPDFTTTTSPPIVSESLLPITAFDFVACLGSPGGFPTFDLELVDAEMDPELCANACLLEGLAFSGTFSTECYCAASLGTATDEVSGSACNIICPGNDQFTCGGNAGRKIRVRDVDPSKLLDVYQFSPLVPATTTTSASFDTTSSDGIDPTPEPRALNADMELNNQKHRVRQLRSGGVLRGEKKSNANLRVKRDFGMRNPFGL